MIGNRVMFGFILLFFTLVLTILTAPILDNQLVSLKLIEESTNQTITTTEAINYDDGSSESNETMIQSTTVGYKAKTTTIPKVVTNGLLFANTSDVLVDIDEIIRMSDRLFSENQDELPATPTTESPEASQSNKKDDDDK